MKTLYYKHRQIPGLIGEIKENIGEFLKVITIYKQEDRYSETHEYYFLPQSFDDLSGCWDRIILRSNGTSENYSLYVRFLWFVQSWVKDWREKNEYTGDLEFHHKKYCRESREMLKINKERFELTPKDISEYYVGLPY